MKKDLQTAMSLHLVFDDYNIYDCQQQGVRVPIEALKRQYKKNHIDITTFWVPRVIENLSEH